MTTETATTEITADEADAAERLWRKTAPHSHTMNELATSLDLRVRGVVKGGPANLADLTAEALAAVQAAEAAIESLRTAAAQCWHRPTRYTAADAALGNAKLVRRETDESHWYLHPTQRGMWVNADSGQQLTAAALLASGDLVTAHDA